MVPCLIVKTKDIKLRPIRWKIADGQIGSCEERGELLFKIMMHFLGPLFEQDAFDTLHQKKLIFWAQIYQVFEVHFCNKVLRRFLKRL